MDSESIVYHSPIGFIEIKGTQDFINAIIFHDEDPNIPAFIETEENALIKLAHDQVRDYFEKGLKQFTFPVLQEGTHFQQAVWKELIEIPFGKTISYLQLA